MKRKLLVPLAILLALSLTGCNLIRKDPVKQTAKQLAAVQEEYATVLAEYDGGSVTVLDIISELNQTLNMYSYYGIELTQDVVDSVQRNVVDYQVQDAALAAHAEEYGASLSEEELEDLTASVQSDYQSAYDYFLGEADGDTDEVRAKQAEYSCYAIGCDLDNLLEHQKSVALGQKVIEAVKQEVTSVDEAAVRTLYEDKLTSDEETYAGSPASFESAMLNGSAVTWMPEGYRTVKHILVKPADDVLEPVNGKRDEVETLENSLISLNTALETANDDDAQTERLPEDIQAEIDSVSASLEAAKAELVALEAACMASVQDKLDEIYARIEAGEDFDALIAEYGEDAGMQSEPAKSTGYYVCADSTSLDLPFKTAAMLLEKVGDVSEPTLGQYGVHIIRYESDVTPGAVAFEQVQAALTEEALTQQQELHYQEKLEAWLSDLNVVYHYDAWKAYESNALQ